MNTGEEPTLPRRPAGKAFPNTYLPQQTTITQVWESQKGAEPTITENILLKLHMLKTRFIEAAEVERGSDQVETQEFLLYIPSLLAPEAANQPSPLLSLPSTHRISKFGKDL